MPQRNTLRHKGKLSTVLTWFQNMSGTSQIWCAEWQTYLWKKKDCKVCEKKCAKQCPTNALSVYGISKTVEEIAEEAYRDSMVFPEFGGVTFSGGECLLQAQNVKKTAEILKQKGIHICIDTALNVEWDTIEENTAIYRSFSCRYKSRNRRNTQKIQLV